MSDDLGFDLPPPAKVSTTRFVAVALGVGAVFAAALLIGLVPRWRANEELAAQATERSHEITRVDVVVPKVLSSDHALALPGSVQALEETTLYPRANGYVRDWKKDIGDKVDAGALLAEIDVPEIDQQFDQARAKVAQAEAALVQAKANAGFSETNLKRYETLAPTGVASQQELDKTRAQKSVDDASVIVASANVEAQRANLRRLAQSKAFGKIVAPFAGTITSRTIERGALVSGQSPLFKLASTDTVRVVVQVPQDVAPSVRVGVPAKIKVREYPNRDFEAKVAHAAGALDPQVRTMSTEVRVPNEKGELLVGMYAEVELSLPSPHRVLEVPATALAADSHGLRVAIVTPENRIHLAPIVVERDTGATIQVASGITEGDRVVKIMSAELTENRPVEVAKK